MHKKLGDRLVLHAHTLATFADMKCEIRDCLGMTQWHALATSGSSEVLAIENANGMLCVREQITSIRVRRYSWNTLVCVRKLDSRIIPHQNLRS